MLLQQKSNLEPVFLLLTLSEARLSGHSCRKLWWVLAPPKTSGVENGGLPRMAEGVNDGVPGLGQIITLSTRFYPEETFGDITLPVSIEDGLTSVSHDFLSFRVIKMEMVPQREPAQVSLRHVAQSFRSTRITCGSC